MPIGHFEYSYPSEGWVRARAGRDPADELGIRLVGTPNGTVSMLYADIPGQSWTTPRLDLARQFVQDAMDHRIPRASLSPEHDYIKDGDPAQEWLFWDGTDVVVRLVVISAITWIGYPNFDLWRPKRRDWLEAHS